MWHTWIFLVLIRGPLERLLTWETVFTKSFNKAMIILPRLLRENKKCFRNIYAPVVHNSRLSSLYKQNLSEASRQEIKIYKVDKTVGSKSGLNLTFEQVTWNQQGSSTHWGQPLHQVWYWSSEGVRRYWADKTVGSKEWFDLDLICEVKINRDHLLVEGNPCTKFGIDQVKGSNDIERTRQWAQKSGLTMTFEQVTWKSIGIIYSLRATPAPSLVLIK